jgi:hypothetical protein
MVKKLVMGRVSQVRLLGLGEPRTLCAKRARLDGKSLQIISPFRRTIKA